MAIPLSMPNSDDIEDSHRLDLLLEQLLITLRQVLIQRRRMAAAAAVSRTSQSSHLRHRHETAERTRTEETESTSDRLQQEEETTTTTTRVTAEEESTTTPSLQLPLPDLVMDSPSGKDGRRPAGTCHHDHLSHHLQRSRTDGTSWVEDGSELIRLAGQLLDQEEVDAKSGAAKVKKKEKSEEERMNVLSLMCPLLGNSVWTTVALLVVWGLLSHAR
ncbi:UNVERIFIED_CONTAM: hypothetical protein PYX00_003352 [Menopon gallinae]|uniref:Uncharacterized protein n=1 Tax=Menopon gallinae TaxID=328185 RepID=A0AAW2I0F5_9NEOP